MLRVLLVASYLLGALACERPTTGLSLFDKYYLPYELKLEPQVLDQEPLLKPAYDAYLRRDFKEVARVTGDFTRNEVRLPLVMLIQSIAYIELDSNRQAIDMLSVVEAHPAYGAYSSWYKALALLREGDTILADLALESIHETTAPPKLYADALRLRAELKELP